MNALKWNSKKRLWKTRSQWTLPLNSPAGISLEIAESKSELEQAYGLLALPLSRHTFLPSTRVLIAKHLGRIVGALEVTAKGAFGLPLQRDFQLPPTGVAKHCAQLSATAVMADLDLPTAEVMASLFHYARYMCLQFWGITDWVMTTDLNHYTLLRKCFRLRSLGRKTAAASLFARRPAGRWVDISQDLHLMPAFAKYCEQSFFMQLPNEDRAQLSKPVWKTEWLEAFFGKRTELFSSFSAYDRWVLHRIYPECGWIKESVEGDTLPQDDRRTDPRFEVNLHTETAETQVQVEIQNVSRHGLGGIFDSQVQLGKCEFELNLTNGQSLFLKGQILWQSPQGHFGLQIDHPPFTWSQWISDLEQNPKNETQSNQTGQASRTRTCAAPCGPLSWDWEQSSQKTKSEGTDLRFLF